MSRTEIEKLMLITAPEQVPDEDVLLNYMFAEGLQVLHLRKPGHTAEQIQQLLSRIKAEYHERIVLPFSLLQDKRSQLNDCRKVHFFEHLRQNTKTEYFEALKSRGYTLSTSVHDAATIVQLPSAFSYTFFGPVFDSISKPGYKAIQRQELHSLSQDRTIARIALGGVDEHNCSQALDWGFDGVAVLGAIWKAEDPVAAFKQIQQCLTNDR